MKRAVTKALRAQSAGARSTAWNSLGLDGHAKPCASDLFASAAPLPEPVKERDAIVRTRRTTMKELRQERARAATKALGYVGRHNAASYREAHVEATTDVLRRELRK